MKAKPMAFWTMALIALSGGTLHAESRAPRSAGYRVELLTAHGDPANDMVGSGIFLRREITVHYQAEIAFEYVEYDFESPQRYLGFPRSSGEDAAGRTRLNLVSAKLERAWGLPGQAVRPFAFLGLGLGYAVLDDIAGTAEGQSFDIDAEGGIESVPACGAGLRYQKTRWLVEGGAKAERHLADWRLEDRRSGRAAEVGDYTAWGAWLGAGLLF